MNLFLIRRYWLSSCSSSSKYSPRNVTTLESCLYYATTISVLGTLKFVAKGEDNQVYGMLIPDVMIYQEIEKSKAYQIYLAYLTGAATPKKARKWKQAATKPKTTSSFTADGNIISDETDDVLANIPTRRIRQSGLALLKKDSRKVMKFSLRDLRSQHQTGGSSEGVSVTPEVPDESQAKSTNTNKGDGITPEVLDMYKAGSMIQDLEEDWGSKEDTVILTSEDERIESVKKTTESGKNDDDMSIDLDETDDEED
ncbi:hypothetical protein Tco_1089893 [Tanacetum coccineum]|uniref:Uncharacterized protein n=1 Tax=Tanacetum coccineum TaxID=301880 RepID=A0ABQ5I2Q7_9ASTR